MGGCKVDPKIAFVKPLSGVLYTVERFWLQGGLDRRSLARLARVGRVPSTEWSIIGQTGEARLGFGMMVSSVSALRSGRRVGKVAMGGLETGGHGHVRHRWLLLDVPVLSFAWSKYLGKLIQGDFPRIGGFGLPHKDPPSRSAPPTVVDLKRCVQYSAHRPSFAYGLRSTQARHGCLLGPRKLVVACRKGICFRRSGCMCAIRSRPK